MNLSPGAVQIVVERDLNDLEYADQLDGPRRAELVAQIDTLRNRLSTLRVLSDIDALACLLINLGAVRFEQERYPEALALFDEAQALVYDEGYEIQHGDRHAALRPARFRVVHAVAQYNRAMVFFEMGVPGSGAEALGYANDKLSMTTPNALCEELHVALTAKIDAAQSHV